MKKEIPMYYVAMVLPVENADDVLQGIEDYSFVNAQRLEEQLTTTEIPIINLRHSEKMEKIGRGVKNFIKQTIIGQCKRILLLSET